jgi:phospholipid/cholesterol/gamma-HCH transport system permease protein
MSPDLSSKPYGDGGAAPSTLFPRITRTTRGWAAGWNRIGRQTQFYATTVRSIGDVLVSYRIELVRLIAQMSLGTGALVLVGGAVVVVAFLVFAAGTLAGQQGWATLHHAGVEALLGFLAGYLNVRVIAPLISTVALAATIGAGATAQIGAMRINEEIDALEVIGVRSVSYLASSRVIAGVFVVIPLYCVALVMGFLGLRMISALYGQSSGVYNHYMHTFLNPMDAIWSLVLVIVAGTVVMLIHTYYGYTASGGPAGVGEAVGRAVRTSLIVTVFVILFMSLAIYGRHGNFHLSG